MKALADIRKNYAYDSLSESDVQRDPIRQFSHWFDQALEAEIPEPNAMTLATADAEGRPSARIVLIKGVDERGFTFFTNYLSRKGQELAVQPYASLLFHWVELERQVRIEGRVEKIDTTESDTYFHSRPPGSRIGAWASEQSTVIASRDVIVAREDAFKAQYGDNPPRPSHWGGYRLNPDTIEFWQGRPSRLHDRIRFRRTLPLEGASTPGPWTIERLSP